MKIHVTIKSPTGDELHSFTTDRDTKEKFDVAIKQFASDIVTGPYTSFHDINSGRIIMMQAELLRRCSLIFVEVKP